MWICKSIREKYNLFCNFPIWIGKEVTNIDKDGNEIIVTISYKIRLIDSARFMGTYLSNLVDNLTEWIHKIKYKDCGCFVENESVRDNLMIKILS